MDNNKKSNNTWAIVIGVIVVIIVIVLIVRHKNNTAAVAPVDQGTTAGDTTNGTDTTSTPVVGTATAVSPSASTMPGIVATSLSYDSALNIYGANRIQFDPSCQATPNAEVYKNNTTIMLDNRSADTRVIHLGQMGDATLKPWGFALFNVSSLAFPKVFAVDCGTSQNVATLTIDK